MQDQEFIYEMKKRGVDMVNKVISDENGGLDVIYFI